MLIPIHKFTFGVCVIKPLRPLGKAAWDTADNPGYRPTPLGRGKRVEYPCKLFVRVYLRTTLSLYVACFMYNIMCSLAFVFSDIAHNLIVLCLTRKTHAKQNIAYHFVCTSRMLIIICLHACSKVLTSYNVTFQPTLHNE